MIDDKINLITGWFVVFTYVLVGIAFLVKYFC